MKDIDAQASTVTLDIVGLEWVLYVWTSSLEKTNDQLDLGSTLLFL